MIDYNILKQSTILHLCFAISYFTSGLIINVVQAILYLGLKPFNKRLYRQINYYLLYSFYSQLVFMSTWWAGTRIHIYVKKDEYDKYYGKEHGYLLMNHSYEVDWLMGWQFCDGVHVLGNCKAYAKKSISYVPPIGWMWKFGEFVFLERSFDRDQEIIKKQISEICDYPDPVWLLMMAEGTRFTPSKHEASIKFAKEKGLPMLKHHLTPRTKGFTTSLINMRGRIPAIYNIQVAFHKDSKICILKVEGQVKKVIMSKFSSDKVCLTILKVLPTMTSLLYGKGLEAHLFIERIPLEQVPLEEEDASKWLHELYVKKDRMQDSFFKTGDFFKESGVERIEPFEVAPRVYSLLNTLGWTVATLVPILYYLVGLLLSGELLYFSIACAFFGIFHILLQKTIGMSKISQGSSYGDDKHK